MQSAANTTGQTPPRPHRAGAPLVLDASVPAAEPSAPLASAAIRDREIRFPVAA